MVVAADMMVGPEGTATVGRTSTFCHHRLEGLLEVGKFADEVLGEHQVLHVLELVGEAVDQDHCDDVVNSYHTNTVRIEDSNEGVFLSKKLVEIFCERGGHL